MPSGPERIRVISEGRPGHENQSVGLAQAIARRTGAAVEIARVPADGWLFARCRAALQPLSPPPDLLIGAGHKVHLPMWYAARKFGARSVVIMKPTWPHTLFDLCILPQHDVPPDDCSGRLIRTIGALNRLPEETPVKKPKGVVLLGGPSKAHGWAAEATAAAVIAVVKARPELAWTIGDSRRTPGNFLDQLRRQGLKAEFVPHQQTRPEWLPAQLMAAEEVWVTEDSISMIFEAVTAGARTGILPTPVTKPNADPVNAIRKLVGTGRATEYETWLQNGRQLPPPKPLHETGRCADLVLERLFRNRPPIGK